MYTDHASHITGTASYSQFQSLRCRRMGAVPGITFGHCDDVGWKPSTTVTVCSQAGALDARPTTPIAVLLGIRQLVPG